METALIVGVVGGAVGLASTITTAIMTTITARSVEQLKHRFDSEKRAAAERQEISIYSEALARSAFDLQSRLYNFLKNDFAFYLEGGDGRDKIYAVEYTTFLIGQFFCWVELTRREINFIKLDDHARTKSLLRKQDDIYATWGTDKGSVAFRIFAGEQRAIGEALIEGEHEYTTCMGYGSFLEAYPRGQSALIDYVRDQVEALPLTLEAARARLTTIQHMLIDILDIIDGDRLRFPDQRRSKA